MLLAHGAHGRQLSTGPDIIGGVGGRTSWLHDVGKVDPLVASTTVAILCRVWLRTRYLVDATHSLGVVGSHKHWWLAMARARRLRAGKTVLIERLSVSHARRLDQMDLLLATSAITRRRRRVTRLQIVKKGLNFLVAA